MLYLDNPATTHRKPMSVMASLFYNSIFNSVNAGRGAHRYSIRGANVLNSTADTISELFNIDTPERIIFTPNATLALNMAIGGTLVHGGHTIVTSMEHNSVLRPVHSFGNYTMVYANSEGLVSPSDIETAIGPDTRLIVCTHASNVCGSIQPIAEIGKIARRHSLLFLVDAAQTAGTVDIDVQAMNIDMLAFSGHKGLMSPLGTGGLYVGERTDLVPIISGGTGSDSESLTQPDYLPDMLHVGTLNTPAIAALGTGARYVLKNQGKILCHERSLAEEFITSIADVRGVQVLGSRDISHRNGTVAFTFNSLPSGEAAQILDSKFGIAARGGWHCAYYAHCNLGSEEYGAVRVGFGWYNTHHDVKRLVHAVKKIAKM